MELSRGHGDAEDARWLRQLREKADAEAEEAAWRSVTVAEKAQRDEAVATAASFEEARALEARSWHSGLVELLTEAKVVTKDLSDLQSATT